MSLNSSEAFEAVRTTFEEMAFLDVIPGSAPESVMGSLEGPIPFLGYTLPVQGAFALRLPKSIKFLVAEAIYGFEWNALTPGQLDDSLLELMNVLAGRLLAGRFGAKRTYTMGLPTLLFDPPAKIPGWSQQEFVFHVDQTGFILVWSEEA